MTERDRLELRDRLALREEDLTPAEQDALAVWRQDPANDALARDEEAIGARIASLPAPAGPNVGRARARLATVRRREQPPWQRYPVVTAAAVALAAAFLLVALPVPSSRGRLHDLQVAANVVGDRVLDPGAAVRAQEQVALTVTTSAPGWLTIVEEGTGVVLSEHLDAGTHEVLLGALGAAKIPGETRLFRALLCDGPADASTDFTKCATVALPLRVDG